MTDKTVLGSAALDMAIDAETHVNFVNWHDAIHRFDRSVAFLARNTGPDMRFVHELDEVRQHIDPIPPNLERRLMVIGPCSGNRPNTAEQGAAMAPDTTLDRWHAGGLGPARILVAILARNFVNACMHTMAKGERLLDVGTRRPRPLRKGDRGNAGRKQEQRNRNQYAVHRRYVRSRLRLVRAGNHFHKHTYAPPLLPHQIRAEVTGLCGTSQTD
jgi:hypothetical protein